MTLEYNREDLDLLLDTAGEMKSEHDQAELIREWERGDLKLRMSECTKCRIRKNCKQVVSFSGPTHGTLVAFIAEAPGETEDEEGRPLCGAAGQLLDGILRNLSLVSANIPKLNIISCRPERSRDPIPSEIESCSGWLKEQIELIDPWMICGLGRVAMKAIHPGQTLKNHGRFFEISKGKGLPGEGRIGMFTYHPAGCFEYRDPTRQRYNDLHADIARIAQIAAAREQFGADFLFRAQNLIKLGIKGDEAEQYKEMFL